MKMYLSIITILILNSFCFSQEEIIVGKVLNAESHEGLAYVNIGIAKKSVGTVTDFNGAFNLELNDKINESDTIVFSYIGFITQKYPVSELLSKQNIILLSQTNIKLAEVTVSAERLKSKKIGRTTKGLGLTHLNFYSYYEKNVDDRLSKEVGMKLKIRKNCYIKDLNFNITSNQFKSLKFRVNFYKIDNELPTDLIVQEDIIFEIKDGYLGWFKVDLEPYDICIGKEVEHIAVTIQWIESEKMNSKSKYFSISTTSSPFANAYFRKKAMDTWTKAGQSHSFYLNIMYD